MATKKARIDRVIPGLAEAAMTKTVSNGDSRNSLFTHYIIAHYRTTGNLAPGCDFRDLVAWYEINMADELASITRR